MAEPLPRRMRSTAINLGLVGALAISLTACGGTKGAQAGPRYCVDDFDQVVPDAQCLATPVASPGSTGSRTGTSGRRWYYGGTSSGGRVSGGSYTAPPASASGGSSSGGSKKSGISIGGFGGGSSS